MLQQFQVNGKGTQPYVYMYLTYILKYFLITYIRQLDNLLLCFDLFIQPLYKSSVKCSYSIKIYCCCKKLSNSGLKSESCSVMSDSLQPRGLQPTSSSVHGILQARILEWAAIPLSRGSSQLKQHKFIAFQFWRSEVQNGLEGWHSLWRFQERIYILTFSSFRGCLNFLLHLQTQITSRLQITRKKKNPKIYLIRFYLTVFVYRP